MDDGQSFLAFVRNSVCKDIAMAGNVISIPEIIRVLYVNGLG